MVKYCTQNDCAFQHLDITTQTVYIPIQHLASHRTSEIQWYGAFGVRLCVCIYISIFLYDMLKFPISVHVLLLWLLLLLLPLLTNAHRLYHFIFGLSSARGFLLLNTAPFYSTAAGFVHKMLISAHVFLQCERARVYKLFDFCAFFYG